MSNKFLKINNKYVTVGGKFLQTPSSGYTISVTCTNCTASASNPSTIASGGTATLVFTFDGTSYKCPSTAPSVTGATGSWTKDSDTQGTMVLSSATGNVSFSVIGELMGYTISRITGDISSSSRGVRFTTYIKLNSDTASSSNYDYKVNEDETNVRDSNGNTVTPANIQHIGKIAIAGSYSDYGYITIDGVNISVSDSPYTLTGDVTNLVIYSGQGTG